MWLRPGAQDENTFLYGNVSSAILPCMFVAARRSPLLAQVVSLLHIHSHESEIPIAWERTLPNGRVHLMVNLCEDEFRT